MTAGLPSGADGLTWFFGYGSLIWRPGFPHRARYPAHLDGFHRAFCRYSLRHRGTPEAPGLVVGLRAGRSCLGVAYGVAAAELPGTLAYLDEREGPGYLRRRVPVTLRSTTGTTQVQAWTYIPNPDHPSYFGEQDPERLVRLVATGHGESGTALDYLRELMGELHALGADEPALAAILAAAERLDAGDNHGG